MTNILGYILNLEKYLAPLVKLYGVFVYILLFVVIVLETGLVIAPFLPGESLLFVAGTLAVGGTLSLPLLLVIFSIAAILGDSLNYWISGYFGKKFLSKYINPKNFEKTEEFYKQYGAKTIIIARFIPFVRTLAPAIAGISKMQYSKFFVYNVIGGVIWVFSFVFAGYFFGTIPFVQNNFLWILAIIIAGSVIYGFIEYKRQIRKRTSQVI